MDILPNDIYLLLGTSYFSLYDLVMLSRTCREFALTYINLITTRKRNTRWYLLIERNNKYNQKTRLIYPEGINQSLVDRAIYSLLTPYRADRSQLIPLGDQSSFFSQPRQRVFCYYMTKDPTIILGFSSKLKSFSRPLVSVSRVKILYPQ